MHAQLDVRTGSKRELKDITSKIKEVISESGVEDGLCHIFVPHTTAGLILNENWDPEVRGDLIQALEAIVPGVRFRHGEGNSPAHFLSAVVGVSETLLVRNAGVVLGSWQGIYLAEFDGPRSRHVHVKVVEDPA